LRTRPGGRRSPGPALAPSRVVLVDLSHVTSRTLSARRAGATRSSRATCPAARVERTPIVSGRTVSTVSACHGVAGMTERRRVWFSRPQGGGWLGAAGALEGGSIVRGLVVVPEGFDRPGRPTGGNIYDRRVCVGLAEAGWDVLVTTVGGAWPVPGSGARADLARIVSAIPDGETVLIDGLI